MNNKTLKLVATDKRLKGMHLRVYILLCVCGALTQYQLVELLQSQKQNINKYVKELESWGYIKLSKVEGKNKFYCIEKDDKRIKQVLIGQQDVFDKLL